jgi:hypothetical protein
MGYNMRCLHAAINEVKTGPLRGYTAGEDGACVELYMKIRF